jgi:hypothetical protein
LLQFKETPTPIAPKVEWVKSSAILKTPGASKIVDLPNIEQITPKPVVAKPTIAIPLAQTAQMHANNTEKEKPLDLTSKLRQKENQPKESTATDTRYITAVLT